MIRSFFSYTDLLDRKPTISLELSDGSFFLGYIDPSQPIENPSLSDPIFIIEKLTKTTETDGKQYLREVSNGRYVYNVAWTDRDTLTYKMA